MNKVKHYPILSQTCIHFTVQTTPVQFNWSISKTCNWFYSFSSTFISPIYFPYIYIYVTYMLDLILHICNIYCKILIFRVTLFSRAHDFGFIHETLFSRLLISCTIILTRQILAWTLFSRVTGLANLRENKVLANKKCFTVHIANIYRHSEYI